MGSIGEAALMRKSCDRNDRRNGMLSGGSDPRSDGAAIGY
jgi:hypothetical protein